METRVVVIGIGGGSSSGKTTLTTQLRSVIPECALLRQDNFWTPIDKVPLHPVYNVPDLEDPPGTIDWPAFRETFKRFRSAEPFIGDQPESSDTGSSSSSFNATLPDELLDEWRNRFKRVEKERMRQGVKIEWRIVEGFVLYYEPEITKDLDVSILLRSPGHVLQKRSNGRQYLHTDGTIWVATSEHWDRISYPAYIRAHEHLFHNGDVDRGSPIETYNLTMLDGQGTERNMSFEEFFTTAASAILRLFFANYEGQGCSLWVCVRQIGYSIAQTFRDLIGLGRLQATIITVPSYLALAACARCRITTHAAILLVFYTAWFPARSSSGKTTLAKQLGAVIPGCIVLHQDDFWAPQDKIPMHPVYGVPDLEDPPTTIDWPLFREVFKRFRSAEPFEYNRPEWSGAGSPLPLSSGRLPESLLNEWENKFKQVEKERMSQGIKVEWRIVEGFVLYYEPEIIKDLDVPIFLRSPGHILQKRSSGRECPQNGVYIDGTVWVAPPEYWDQLTYPAYIHAHSHLFHNGDVDWGTPIESFDLMVLDGEGTERSLSFEDFFTSAASAILEIS